MYVLQPNLLKYEKVVSEKVQQITISLVACLKKLQELPQIQ